MKCPRCGYDDCRIIAESETTGSDYSVCKGICGGILLGPLGTICGWTDDRKTETRAYWVCKKCGFKFEA